MLNKKFLLKFKMADFIAYGFVKDRSIY